ncbi:MAG: response regulator [Hyphomonadaceae bacterium]|nr:response regulator [Hyphomonadaceae bacterium]
MQYFINHAAIERAAAEVFSSERARYYLYGIIALAVAAVASAALGAIWLGVALLVDAARKTLTPQLRQLSAAQAAAAALALDVATAASLAVAPAIAWYCGAAMGGAIATALLVALTIDVAMNAKRGRVHALVQCAPYAVLGLTILAQSGQLAAAAASGLVIAYIFAASMQRTHRAAHARMQDTEWVRQLNMSFGDSAAVGWEIDFARGRVAGAQRLSALIGRPISYTDIIERSFFSPAHDRPLVNAAFAPAKGAVRRIALEHDVVRTDGTIVRIRHQGFVRTTPDGVPVRITCVTRPAGATSVGVVSAGALNDAQVALARQAEALRTLNNELAAAAATDVAEVSASLAQILHLLAERSVALERGVDDLAHARHEADAANLAKSQFLANMSHELRTPLNAIIGYAEMLQEDAEDNGDDRAVQDLNRILTAAKHLLSLIGEILDLSKIEAGRMEAVATKFDPMEMLEDLIETIRPIASSNGNEINLTGSPIDGGGINTDATKLSQCVLNLLSNAAKFTKHGEIDISFDRRLHNGVDQLFISVRDTGIGMSKEHVSRLFQPFVQADPTITQQYGGTGLGLTITRRLCQLLGGDVTVKSAPGEGSTFVMHVPVDLADAASALGAAAKIDDVQGSEDAPLVIVIEDEADARELAARALTRAGFAVQGVGGGETGLALARAKAPALVLLDIFLPDRSGWRVLQSLKHDPKTQDIPVVVLSVNEDRAHALALGAAEHIVKPADRDMLAATVMRYARKRPLLPLQTAAPAARKAAG